MTPHQFANGLKANGLTFISGVPDSTFKIAYNTIIYDSSFTYIPATREDAALGIASAAYFAGRYGTVFMQNSGLGNIVNSLTSFNLIYGIPVLIVIGWRGFDGKDAPEHSIMGRKTPQLLDLLGIKYIVLEKTHQDQLFEELINTMSHTSAPVALLVREGSMI